MPTLYILQRDSYVVKSAKIRPFTAKKNIEHLSCCHGNYGQNEPAFSQRVNI